MRPYVHDQTLSLYRRHQTWCLFDVEQHLTKMEILRGKKLTINFRFWLLLWRRWFALMVNLLSCEIIWFFLYRKITMQIGFWDFLLCRFCELEIRIFWDGKIVCSRLTITEHFFCICRCRTNGIFTGYGLFRGNVELHEKSLIYTCNVDNSAQMFFVDIWNNKKKMETG